MKFLAIVAFALLLTGCNSIGNRHDPSLVVLNQVPKDSGVAIISAGAAEKCYSTSTFLQVKSYDKTDPSPAKALLGVDVYTQKSDFADHQGNIYALVLPAGNYFMFPWIANPYAHPSHVQKVDFSVAAGEIVYLGEYYISVACTPFSVSVLRDAHERDNALLLQKNPALAGANIVTRIPQFSEFVVNGKPINTDAK